MEIIKITDNAIIEALKLGIREPHWIIKHLNMHIYKSEYPYFAQRVRRILGLRQYGLERKEIYDIHDILPYINDRVINFDGDLIKMQSLRYYTFKEKGTVCAGCGIEGAFFAKEHHVDTKKYHFNLYGYTEDCLEILLTVDHLIPLSKGGKNHITNAQTLCKVCNEKKGNLLKSSITASQHYF